MKCLVTKLKGAIKDNSLPFFKSFVVEVNSNYKNSMIIASTKDAQSNIFDDNGNIVSSVTIYGNGTNQVIKYTGKGKIAISSENVTHFSFTDGSKIDKFDVSCLLDCNSLTHFQMGYNNNLSGDILEHLKECIELQELWIPNTSFTGDIYSLSEYQKANRAASTLVITNNGKLTNNGVVVTKPSITITFDGNGNYTIL